MRLFGCLRSEGNLMPEYKAMRAEGKRVGNSHGFAAGRRSAGIERGNYKKDWVDKLCHCPCYFLLTKEGFFLRKVNNLSNMI